jgi:hypothetical protein
MADKLPDFCVTSKICDATEKSVQAKKKSTNNKTMSVVTTPSVLGAEGQKTSYVGLRTTYYRSGSVHGGLSGAPSACGAVCSTPYLHTNREWTTEKKS